MVFVGSISISIPITAPPFSGCLSYLQISYDVSELVTSKGAGCCI